MKNRFLVVCIVAITLLAQACEPKHDGYTIKGKVTGFKEGSMIYLRNMETGETVDSSAINNGKFSFIGKVDFPQRYYLNNERAKGVKFVVTSFYLDNASVTVEGDFKDFENCKITGGKSQQVFHEINSQTKALLKQRGAMFDEVYSGNYTKEEVKELRSKIDDIAQQIKVIEQEWVRKNINTYPAVNRLANQPDQFPLFSREENKNLYNLLSEELKNTADGQFIYNKYAFEPVKVGNHFYDFDAIQPDGSAFKLSEFSKGKYTLLMFTGVSCKWCRVMEKDLKGRYDRVKDNLNAVSFYVESRKDYWLNYVTKKPKPWTVVTDLKRYKSKAVIHYGVIAVPQAVLIDKKGEIIKISEGYEESFMNELEEIVTK